MGSNKGNQEMFTGLIAEVGEVSAVKVSGEGMELAIAARLAAELSEGDSVSVNGVCLTATAVSADGFSAEVVNETLRASSLAEISGGARVNLELPPRAGDRFGGHIVQGHVDGVGTVKAIEPDGFSQRITISATPEILKYIVHKGSITVDGISLTVAARAERDFTVAVIPETLTHTNLGEAQVGRVVNLEVDVVAKYVEGLIAR